MKRLRAPLLIAVVFCAVNAAAAEPDKQLLLIAGKPSHGPGEHEQNAAVLYWPNG